MTRLSGARVLVTGRDAERGASVVEQCEGRAAFVAADLTEPDAADRLVSAALERFASLTVVVNNAVGHSTGGTVLTTGSRAAGGELVQEAAEVQHIQHRRNRADHRR